MDASEHRFLARLDGALRQPGARARIDRVAARLKTQLAEQTDRAMTWEPLPLEIYGDVLPEPIQSSWVFVLRAGIATGAERHPNSHQRMTAWEGDGDFQTRTADDEPWQSNLLTSRADADIDRRWISIPTGVWHQSARPENDWVVVSFHTVPAEELIEERPGEAGAVQMRYV